MRKQYSLKETEEKGKFHIITLPNGQKDIILADGTSILKKYFPGINGLNIDEIIKDNDLHIYSCGRHVPGESNPLLLVSNKDGGKVFDQKICNYEVYETKDSIKIKKRDKVLKYGLIDYDFNIILDARYDDLSWWKNDIVQVWDMIRGNNLFDITLKKFIFDDWLKDIWIINNYLSKIEYKNGEWTIINDEGEFILTTKSGSPKKVSDITSGEMNFYDNDPKTLEYIIVEDGEDFESLYITDKNNIRKVEMIHGNSVLGEGSYKIMEDEPRHDMLMVSDIHEKSYNFVSIEGKLQFNPWFESYDRSTLSDIYYWVILRNGKYNFVDLESMSPVFENDEWVDDYVLVEDYLGNNYVAVKRNNKCNLLQHERGEIMNMILKDWCDDVLIEEDSHNHKIIFVKYNNESYIINDEKLVKADKASIGNYGSIILKLDGKYNAMYIGDAYFFIDDFWADNIYRVHSNFPIIEKDGKYNYLNLNLGNVLFPEWFDDVEAYDDEVDNYQFVVYDNGKKRILNIDGEDIE